MAVAAVVALAACPASRVCLNEPVSDGVTRSTKAAAPEGLAAVLDLGHIMHFLAGARLAASLRDALMDVFIYIRANRRQTLLLGLRCDAWTRPAAGVGCLKCPKSDS